MLKMNYFFLLLFNKRQLKKHLLNKLLEIHVLKYIKRRFKH